MNADERRFAQMTREEFDKQCKLICTAIGEYLRSSAFICGFCFKGSHGTTAH
jgi:hypothetical protein